MSDLEAPPKIHDGGPPSRHRTAIAYETGTARAIDRQASGGSGVTSPVVRAVRRYDPLMTPNPWDDAIDDEFSDAVTHVEMIEWVTPR